MAEQAGSKPSPSSQSSGSLGASLSLFRDSVSDIIKAGKSILVATHIDCDGLTSGSIVAKALIRAGAKCAVTALKEFGGGTAESFRKDSRDFHIVTDLGGALPGIWTGRWAGTAGSSWTTTRSPRRRWTTPTSSTRGGTG